MSSGNGPAGGIAGFFIDSKLTPLIIIASNLLGIAAVIALPREEEPQIIVPMIDVFVQMPGAGAKEVERRQINDHLDPIRLAAYGLDAKQVSALVAATNQASHSGSYPSRNELIVIHTGGFLKDEQDVGRYPAGACRRNPFR